MISEKTNPCKCGMRYWPAVLMGIAIVCYSLLCFDGRDMWYRLWYYTPAGVLAGMFAEERFRMRATVSWKCYVIDIVVAMLCLARPLCGYPPASGHAVFSVYVFLTAVQSATRVCAASLLALTLFAKLYVWHGDVTLWPGLAAGFAAGFIYRLVVKRQAAQSATRTG